MNFELRREDDFSQLCVIHYLLIYIHCYDIDMIPSVECTPLFPSESKKEECHSNEYKLANSESHIIVKNRLPFSIQNSQYCPRVLSFYSYNHPLHEPIRIIFKLD